MARIGLVAVAVVGLSACGGEGTQVDVGGPDGGSAPPVDTTGDPAETGADAAVAPGGCRVSPEPTGPIFDPELQTRYGQVQPGQPDFDWDGDGESDVLRFETSTQSVVVDHGGGSFTVTGVPSDFGDVIYRGPGVEIEEAGPDGPPSAEAFGQGRAGPTPAAAGDFTGDGRPDLAVFRDGDLVVHANAAQDAVGASSREFAAPRSEGSGWSSPRTDTDLPLDDATVVAVGDIDGDGIGDLRVDSYTPRAFVSPAFYLGKPCEP